MVRRHVVVLFSLARAILYSRSDCMEERNSRMGGVLVSAKSKGVLGYMYRDGWGRAGGKGGGFVDQKIRRRQKSSYMRPGTFGLDQSQRDEEALCSPPRMMCCCSMTKVVLAPKGYQHATNR